ncbi:DUF2807 domain-containing protein [Hymenobacter sp. BT770]|uniref:GIN domain-containing protein n=1 Tax=Hymenobacter sp. BT770 TaxID=2886942 RepID=UPI001D127981|nr:DUF2807 domain-containing protein [Hymenobacter sp. BT770]MCC3152219.1 DUF2807 domain-containing protein [Hymenobacter sp. BT770]MDO3414033.1 DUF2807 domain-containing protein [Hymenobacter sp. BT770]
MRYTNLRPQVSGTRGFGKMKRLGRAGLGAALAAGLSTCGPGHGTDCLKSTGTVITERREVAPDLVTVTAYDNVDLRLVQDTQTYAEVRTGENLMTDIEFTRKGNSLEINNTSSCNWARSYDTPREVTLHLPRITNVFLRGQGNVSTVGEFVKDTIFFHLVGAGDFDLTLKARQVYLDLYELGDVNLRGSTDGFNFTLGGSGRLFAHDLASRICYFNMTRDSDGAAHVRATEAVGGTVAGNGTFYYSGSPIYTDIKVTGKGGQKRE